MIPKIHGPSRHIEVVPLAGCKPCRGEGKVKGIFHDMPCAGCNGAGLVNKDTGEALESEAMVMQLRLRLNLANKQLAHLKALMPEAGPADDYSRNRNRAGEGGGNWTGD